MHIKRTIRKCLKARVRSELRAFWRWRAAADWSGVKEEIEVAREGKERESRGKRRGTMSRLGVESGGLPQVLGSQKNRKHDFLVVIVCIYSELQTATSEKCP